MTCSQGPYVTQAGLNRLRRGVGNCSYCGREVPRGSGVRGDGDSVFCSHDHNMRYLVGSGPEISVREVSLQELDLQLF